MARRRWHEESILAHLKACPALQEQFEVRDISWEGFIEKLSKPFGVYFGDGETPGETEIGEVLVEEAYRAHVQDRLGKIRDEVGKLIRAFNRSTGKQIAPLSRILRNLDEAEERFRTDYLPAMLERSNNELLDGRHGYFGTKGTEGRLIDYLHHIVLKEYTFLTLDQQAGLIGDILEHFEIRIGEEQARRRLSLDRSKEYLQRLLQADARLTDDKYWENLRDEPPEK